MFQWTENTLSETTGVKLTDPVHGGKTGIDVIDNPVNREVMYNAPDFTVNSYDNGFEVDLGDVDGDQITYKGQDLYYLYFILKDILEKRGYALDNPV
jgi:hypothetical protein